MADIHGVQLEQACSLVHSTPGTGWWCTPHLSVPTVAALRKTSRLFWKQGEGVSSLGVISVARALCFLQRSREGDQ